MKAPERYPFLAGLECSSFVLQPIAIASIRRCERLKNVDVELVAIRIAPITPIHARHKITLMS